jgi:hypothetical protein
LYSGGAVRELHVNSCFWPGGLTKGPRLKNAASIDRTSTGKQILRSFRNHVLFDPKTTENQTSPINPTKRKNDIKK